MKKLPYIFTFAAILFTGLAGCGDNVINSDLTADRQLKRLVLRDIANNVLFRSYDSLNIHAVKLQTIIGELYDKKTPEALEAAREQWRECRKRWMLTQAFLFGPVKSELIDANIDTWPISPTDLSGAIITPDYIHFRDGAVKGFHTVEYLIFGENSDKTVDQITEREYKYLVALMTDMTLEIGKLTEMWEEGSPSDYVTQIAEAGTRESIYPTMEDALQELSENIAFITDVVANRRIFDALYTKDPVVVDSRYSRNTNQDFANIIRGIKNIYLGNYRPDIREGRGFQTLVRLKNTNLDAIIRTRLDAAIDAIENMKPWMGDAMFNDEAKLNIAINAVIALQTALDEAGEILMPG